MRSLLRTDPVAVSLIIATVLFVVVCVLGYFVGVYFWSRPCVPEPGNPCDAAAMAGLSVWLMTLPVSLAVGVGGGFLIFGYLSAFKEID